MDKNVDYNFVYNNNNITFNDGVKTIIPRAMKFIDDNTVEGDEHFTLVINVINPQSVRDRIIVTHNATVIIQDDDGQYM